jgi:hypothetical protein
MLISDDNHVFPSWAPDWLRDAVAAPDCSRGTHPALRYLAKWLSIYFAEHPGDAKRWLTHAAQYCDRDVPDGEVARLLVWAESLFGGDHKRPADAAHEPVERPQVDLEAIYQVACQGPRLAEYRGASPVKFSPERNTAMMLEAWAAYAGQSDPWICFGSRDCFWTRRLSTVREFLYVHEQMVPSPMKAQFGFTADGRLSEHSKDGTGQRLFLVIEFDFSKLTPKGKPTIWVPLLERCETEGVTALDLNAAVLAHLSKERVLWMTVFSGGKSLQGWFPCRDEDEEQLHQWFNSRARRLGADPMTWCRSQFVRMPDGTRAPNREGKSVRQSIQYYDPKVL